MEREVTGPVHAPPKIKSHCQDQNHDFSVLDQCEFDQSEQGVEDPSCIQGKLCENFLFWRDVVKASEFVLDIIQNGYKIIFWESPLPFSIENRSSALHQKFCSGSGVVKAPIYPQFSTHYTSFCSSQTNLNLFWIYLILTNLSLRSLSSTKI